EPVSAAVPPAVPARGDTCPGGRTALRPGPRRSRRVRAADGPGAGRGPGEPQQLPDGPDPADRRRQFLPPGVAASAPAPRRPPPRGAHRAASGPTPSHAGGGQVVRGNTAPRSGARVMSVSPAPPGPQESVTADAQGRFRASLASGSWLVYVYGADGKPEY